VIRSEKSLDSAVGAKARVLEINLILLGVWGEIDGIVGQRKT
jgi:hypothetical protein